MKDNTIGEILIGLRKESGKSVTETAKELDISTSALSMYENGERIPRDNIKIRIANYYHKSVTDIFFTQNAHET